LEQRKIAWEDEHVREWWDLLKPNITAVLAVLRMNTIIYEHIVRRALRYEITVRYQSELPEAKALPETVKKKLEGYESADTLIAKVKQLVNQLSNA